MTTSGRISGWTHELTPGFFSQLPKEDAVPELLNPQPPPLGLRRVHLPAEILYNLEAFQKVQASVLAKAGHPACTSGMQFLWLAYENWAVDPAGEVHPVLPGGEVSED
jgi:hypothetical protein